MQHELRSHLKIKAHMQALPGYQPAAGHVFDRLLLWTHSTSESCEPSQTMIAAALGLSRETVCRAVGWLREQGLVTTVQRYVRQWDGTVLKGTLVYRLAKDVLQSKIRGMRERMDRYRKLMERGLRRSPILAGRDVPGPHTVAASRLSETPVVRGNSRCDVSSATPLRPVLTLEMLLQETGQLASPALQRLMKEKGRSG